MINEELLLLNGYKYFKDIEPNLEIYRRCDKFYQKKLSEFSTINVYYYDKFKENGALDYDYEFELLQEFDNHWKSTIVYGANKKMTLEEIEELLLM
jgi:hypothetical protein